MANATPPNGERARWPRYGFKDLSPCSMSVLPEEVPAVAVQYEEGGLQRIPTHGRLEYARFVDDDITWIFYHSGLIIIVGPDGGAR